MRSSMITALGQRPQASSGVSSTMTANGTKHMDVTSSGGIPPCSIRTSEETGTTSSTRSPRMRRCGSSSAYVANQAHPVNAGQLHTSLGKLTRRAHPQDRLTAAATAVPNLPRPVPAVIGVHQLQRPDLRSEDL